MIKKRTVLITGAGSGLGKMAAISLARRGHKVYATALYEEEVNKLNDIARKNHLDIISFKLDIRLPKDRDKLNFISFDTLINNAAIGDSGSISEIHISRIKNVFDTNVFSNIEITKVAIKKFIKMGYGKIIFIGSLAGRVAIEFLAPYCMSKFSIEAIAECLRQELKKIEYANIKVKLIEPGAYATGFNKENYSKKYEWMKNSSYFKFRLDTLKYKEERTWNFIESKNFKSIIKKYVKAVEANNNKFRYSAPFIQYIFTKLRVLFGIS